MEGSITRKRMRNTLLCERRNLMTRAIPSGNAVAVSNLLAFGADYRGYAEETLRSLREIHGAKSRVFHVYAFFP